MKISILVPIYGTALYIEKCLISLFEQDYENIEFVFVNDKTPYNSLDILINLIQKYQHLKSIITTINHETNIGLSAAINTAIKKSKGDQVIPNDSDY